MTSAETFSERENSLEIVALISLERACKCFSKFSWSAKNNALGKDCLSKEISVKRSQDGHDANVRLPQ